MDFLASIFIFCMVASSFSNGESKRTFNVVDYGAVGDGKTDDSTAFLKAWNALCRATDKPTLQVPGGKTFLLPTVKFQGPCKSQSVQVEILGNIIAPGSIKAWRVGYSDFWLGFYAIRGLIIRGSGKIDGRGSIWWQEESRKRPSALSVRNCSNFEVSGLTITNSPKMHVAIRHCHRGSIHNIHIQAPDESPNTNGIDLSRSTQIQIYDSLIETGDDCVAINGGCYNINVTGIACGPGHGISVGSLGDGEGADIVERVYVRNCKFTGTQNGIRIKTFKRGSGHARMITFEDITLINCKNPIIIDQQYDALSVHGNFTPNVNTIDVSDVTFTSVRGTSANQQAITLDCNRGTAGCRNIVLNRVSLTSSDPKKKTRALCSNAHGTAISTTPAVPCLSKA